MPKVKEKSSAEYYRKLIRTLEKQVRQLEKELTYHRKRHHLAEKEQITLEEELPEVTAPKLPICEDCGKGGMVTKIEFETKVIRECNCCGFKKSSPK